jgi:peroxin-16
MDEAPRPWASALVAAWREAARGNRDNLRSVEAVLRASSYWLPGRFAESELASEGFVSLVNLFAIANDSLAEPDAPPGLRAAHVGALGDATARLQQTWRAHHVLGSVESAAELAAERAIGPRAAWAVVVAVELAKAALKLRLLSDQRDALLRPRANPADEPDDAALPPLLVELAEARKLALARGGAGGGALRSHCAGGSVAEVVTCGEAGGQGRALLIGRWPRSPLADELPADEAADAAACPAARPSRPRQRGAARARGGASGEGARLLLAGELLWALRPLVYVALLTRARASGSRRRGVRAWAPWLASLLVDLVSLLLSAQGVRTRRQALGRARGAGAGAAAARVDAHALNGGAAADGERDAAVAAGRASPPLPESSSPLPALSALLARALDARALDLSGGEAVGARSTVPTEWLAELRRRRLLLLLYLLRAPALQAATQPHAERLGRLLHRMPLVGGLVTNAVDLVHACGERHFYTSGS